MLSYASTVAADRFIIEDSQGDGIDGAGVLF
jgi:hypothetical protein